MAPPPKTKAPKPGKTSGSGGGPGASTAPSSVIPSGDPYTAARQFCGNRANADLVPQQFRDNPQMLAQMYAQYFDPTHQQAAQAGCLAGLHDLGL